MSKIEISGLKEFNKALRELDKDAPKMTKNALNGCSEFIIVKTRAKIPKRTGRAARSLTKKSTKTDVRISVGGRSAPYYPWLDFGGRTGRKKRTVRQFLREGRYLYPTLAENKAEFLRIAESNLQDVAKRAGLELG